MTQQIINNTPGSADTAPQGATKINANFTELYTSLVRTAAEIAAGVTPVNFGYPVLLVDRYGTNTTPGVTGMSAAINAAIAVASAAGGGRVTYLGAPYLIDTPISYVLSNIYHAGVSREATVIVNASSSSPAFTIGDNVSQLFGGGISNVRFTGKSGVVGVAGQAGFLFQKIGQFRVEDVFVSNATSALYRGAHFLNCSQCTIYNLQVQGCLFDGITNVGGVDVYATDCRSDGNAGAGWVLNASQGSLYKSCTAFNNTGVGWSLVSGSPGVSPNKNNQFLQCVGDTSGSYNWQISDSQDSQWVGCWGGTQQSTAVNTFAAGFLVSTQFSLRLGFSGCIAINNNSHGFQIFDPGSSAPTNISYSNCQSINNGQAAGGGYGFSFNGSASHIRWNGGVFSGNITGPVLNQSGGTDNVISGNPAGFVANNQGNGVVATSATSVVVTHGLGFTPNLTNIQVTPTSSMAASSISSYWISTPTATTFTVNTNVAPAGASFNFVWKAAFNGT